MVGDIQDAVAQVLFIFILLFFLQHFFNFLHLYLQQNCTMPIVKRIARIPKPTRIPTAAEFTLLPVNTNTDGLRLVNVQISSEACRKQTSKKYMLQEWHLSVFELITSFIIGVNFYKMK